MGAGRPKLPVSESGSRHKNPGEGSPSATTKRTQIRASNAAHLLPICANIDRCPQAVLRDFATTIMQCRQVPLHSPHDAGGRVNNRAFGIAGGALSARLISPDARVLLGGRLSLPCDRNPANTSRCQWLGAVDRAPFAAVQLAACSARPRLDRLSLLTYSFFEIKLVFLEIWKGGAPSAVLRTAACR